MDAERQRLINQAARISNDIDQQFIDAEYYNSLHPFREPIQADPTGELRHWKRGLDEMLASEAVRGNYPSVVPLKAHRRNHIPVRMTPEMRALWFDGQEN